MKRTLRLLWLILLATPLWGQATPSIANRREGEVRDVVSLREYIDMRFNALEDKVAASNEARQLAIDKAEASTNLRLESMNEFRSQLKDQASQFATKEEVEARARVVDAHLAMIDNRFASFDGQLKVYAGIFVVVQLVLGIWLSSRIPKVMARKTSAHE